MKDFISSKLDDYSFDEGELKGITKPFYAWFVESVKLPKQGTYMKSFFLFQLPIDEAQVTKLMQDHSFKSNEMTRNEWAIIATDLAHEHVPHAWYIIREGYLR